MAITSIHHPSCDMIILNSLHCVLHIIILVTLKGSILGFIIIIIGGAVTSCAGMSTAFVYTFSSKQIYPVSVRS